MDSNSVNTTSNSSQVQQSLPQVLVINPKNALIFKGPSTQSTTVAITLTNPANKWVAFKVKTTAPRRYCVRPNGGFIKGGDTIPVSIVYQPDKDDKDAQDRTRHKFLVQAIFVDNDQVNLEQVWREAGKDKLMESKIRCLFEDQEGGEHSQPAPQGTVHVGQGGTIPMDTDLIGDTRVSNAAPASSSTGNNRQPSKYSEVSAGSANGSEMEVRRLAEDYRRAQDEIANLRDENRRLKDDGVRVRKSLASVGQNSNASSSSSSSASYKNAGPQDLAALLKTDLPKTHIMLALATALLIGAIISQIMF